MDDAQYYINRTAVLEREVAERQERINKAVRSLDTLITRLGYLTRDGGAAQQVALAEARQIQEALRGKE
jgi:hypothetical protein